MRKLGEQWVEVIDGQQHMVKLSNSNFEEIGTCGGCIHHSWYEGDLCDVAPSKPCGGFGYIIKDLGVLNEDWCLPSSWGGYPEVIRVGKPNFVTYFKVSLVVKYGDGSGIQIHVTGKTKQQAIDAWNRRA